MTVIFSSFLASAPFQLRRGCLNVCLAAALLGYNGCAPARPDADPIREASTTSAALDGRDDPTVVAPDAITTPAVGAKKPDVVVTVYSDFQCQFCVRVPMFVNKLATGYGGRVQVQHRHFPLEGAHPHAVRAAVASQAAHRQGAFSCYSRTLYHTRKAWAGLGTEGLETHLGVVAAMCKLDPERFTLDLADGALVDKVRADQTAARALGVRGTPTFLVNGAKPATLRARPDRPVHSTLDSLVLSELRQANKHAKPGKNLEFVAERIYANTNNPEAPTLILE
ncbi:MAG: protein-disulfide isomerase [Myxococcota bacterium]|jgi:protein-disulfide isomerase